MARPSLLDEAMQAEVTRLMGMLMPIRLVCDGVGIDESTFYRWMNRGKAETKGIYTEFYKAVKRSKALAVQQGLSDIAMAGEAGLEGPCVAAGASLPRRVQHPSRIETEAKDRSTGVDRGSCCSDCGGPAPPCAEGRAEGSRCARMTAAALGLTPTAADQFVALATHYQSNRLACYSPCVQAVPYHTSSHLRRLVRAPNQTSKSIGGAVEAWAHLTGVHPCNPEFSRTPADGLVLIADIQSMYPAICAKLP